MSDFTMTARNRVRRVANRGAYDRETVYGIVDEARICHVGFVQDGQPFVIPSIHARLGDDILLHGAKTSRLIKHAQEGHEICITVTLLDGLVLARSAFHHSMNYRSAVLFGRGRLVEDPIEKLEGLRAVVEHVMPGRWDDARQPNEKELNATSVVAIAIESASAKIRRGPPSDDDEDYALPVWAGELPMRQQTLEPVDDPKLGEGISIPDYVRNYLNRG